MAEDKRRLGSHALVMHTPGAGEQGRAGGGRIQELRPRGRPDPVATVAAVAEVDGAADPGGGGRVLTRRRAWSRSCSRPRMLLMQLGVEHFSFTLYSFLLTMCVMVRKQAKHVC